MAKGESRAESIERLRKQAIRKIRTGLKERGLNVPDVEGPSEDDKDLRDLQEWQAMAKAFDEPENPAQAEKSESSNLTFGSSDSAAIGSEMAKVAKSTGFSPSTAPKGAK